MTTARPTFLLTLLLETACVPSIVPPVSVSTSELSCKPHMINTLISGAHVAELRGVVRMPDGQAFPDVTITVRPLGGGRTLGVATSQHDGTFSLPRLPDGWYQLETCHEALQSTVAPIRLWEASAQHSLELVVYLAA